MAGEKVAAVEKPATAELHEKAFEIFCEMVAKSPTARGGEREARSAYMKAEAFLAVRDAIQSGATKASKVELVSPLTDCFAPNLHRLHPYNLVSQRFGDLAKVEKYKQWLDNNPTPEGDPQELVDRLKDKFPELEWKMPDINTARVIFPSYCKN